MKGLKEAGFNVAELGMQTVGGIIKDEYGNKNLSVRYDAWAGDCLGDYLRSFKADCFISIFDLWLSQCNFIPGLMKELKIPWIAHITINSAPLSPYLAGKLLETTIIVAPSKFNYSVLQEAGFQKSVYIPHGYDPAKFYPSSEAEKQQMKEKLELEGKFIFLCVNRNKGVQKNYLDLFYAYKIFLEANPKAKKDSVLLMLNDPQEPEGVNLFHARQRYGLQENIKWIKMKPSPDWEFLEPYPENNVTAFYHHANMHFKEDMMRKIYGIADVHIITSQGESFGLPIVESMACGIPNIFCEHSTGPELIGESKGGLLAKVKTTLSTPLLSEIWLPDPQSIAEKMQLLYTDESLRKTCSENGMKFVKQNYTWDTIIPKWIKLIESIEFLS